MAKRSITVDQVRKQYKPVFHLQTKQEDSSLLSRAIIKQARQSGVLNLSCRGLGTVPEKVWNLNEPDSAEIELSYDLNKSKSEDDAWWNQKTLTNLDLSSNSLKCLSTGLKNLVDLTVLNLHDNALTSIPDEIGCLEKLTKLNISHNKIKELPKSFFRLRELRQLHLAHNQFKEIDPDVSDLVMLETLDISYNQLTTLPGGIGFLVRLNQLTLSHNTLKELPSDIVNLRTLQKLDLMNNELKTLPKYMGELRKLECIYVQHNDIHKLPEFAGCDSLKEIHISNNFITQIPNDFCESLPQLRTLDLRDNKIIKIPDEIAWLQSLMRLDLSNNSINSLPTSLSTLAHLVSLQLDGNPIRSIRRDVLQGGTQRILRTLKDRSNGGKLEPVTANLFENTQNFPDKFQMKKTKALALGMKELVDIPENVFLDAQDANVSNVDLSKNKLGVIPDGLEHLSQMLTELSVSHNQLSALPMFLTQFTKIQYINISSNGFSALPSEFCVLVTVRELNIANNRFKEIPPCVYDMKNLEILLARDNQIERLDASSEGLGAVKRLTVLDLANNNLEYIPPILGNLKNITTLELTGNRLRQPRHQIIAKGTDAIMSYLRDRIPT